MIRSAVLNGTRALRKSNPSAFLNQSVFLQRPVGRELSTLISPLHSSSLSHAALPPCRQNEEDGENKRFSSQPFRGIVMTTPAITGKYKYAEGSRNNIIIREYHVTAVQERGAAIALSLGAIAATAKAGQYAVTAYTEYKAAVEEERKINEKLESEKPAQDESTAKSQDAPKEDTTGGNTTADSGASGAKENAKEGKRENFFAKFFNLSVGSKYYEGGFEAEMTRKEAALILGVRESSTAKRIKEAHRKLLILNHPDTGGSTYLSGKLNEAKELLLQGKKR